MQKSLKKLKLKNLETRQSFDVLFLKYILICGYELLEKYRNIAVPGSDW